MNFLHKTLAKTLTKTWKFTIFHPSIPTHLHQLSLLSSYSTKLPYNQQQPQHTNTNTSETTENNKKQFKKPSEIPYQKKVANWVNFVGTIKIPVEFCTSSDGKSWAATVISQQQGYPSSSLPFIWIQVIFEGDLADTAATHLKVNDNVYIAGHLSPDRFPIDLTNDQVYVQVKVHDVCFVRQFPGAMNYRPKS